MILVASKPIRKSLVRRGRNERACTPRSSKGLPDRTADAIASRSDRRIPDSCNPNTQRVIRPPRRAIKYIEFNRGNNARWITEYFKTRNVDFIGHNNRHGVDLLSVIITSLRQTDIILNVKPSAIRISAYWPIIPSPVKRGVLSRLRRASKRRKCRARDISGIPLWGEHEGGGAPKSGIFSTYRRPKKRSSSGTSHPSFGRPLGSLAIPHELSPISCLFYWQWSTGEPSPSTLGSLGWDDRS